MFLLKSKNKYRVQTELTPFQARQFTALLLMKKQQKEYSYLRMLVVKAIKNLPEKDLLELDKLTKSIKL